MLQKDGQVSVNTDSKKSINSENNAAICEWVLEHGKTLWLFYSPYWINYPHTKEATQWKESFPPKIGKSIHFNHFNHYVEGLFLSPWKPTAVFAYSTSKSGTYITTSVLVLACNGWVNWFIAPNQQQKRRDVIVQINIYARTHSLEKAFFSASVHHGNDWAKGEGGF